MRAREWHEEQTSRYTWNPRRRLCLYQHELYVIGVGGNVRLMVEGFVEFLVLPRVLCGVQSVSISALALTQGAQ